MCIPLSLYLLLCGFYFAVADDFSSSFSSESSLAFIRGKERTRTADLKYDGDVIQHEEPLRARARPKHVLSLILRASAESRDQRTEVKQPFLFIYPLGSLKTHKHEFTGRIPSIYIYAHT